MKLREAAIVLLAVSCADPGPRTDVEDEKTTLAAGVVARVGGEPIPASLVERVAAEQRVGAREAVHRLVDDAVAAHAAKIRRLDRVPPARWRLTSARARLVSDRLLSEAKAKGPPTDAEVEELTLVHWQQVDRAVAVRVVHALVVRPDDPEKLTLARDAAKKLRDAVSGADTPAEFKDRANAFAVPAPLKMRVEELPAFIEEGGWITEGAGQMDVTFAHAAHALAKPGETSPVVETKFGFHVIRLVERIPEQKIALETRRAAFTDEAHMNRARRALDELLKELRAKHEVVVSTSAEQLMRSAMTEPEGEKPR